MTTAKRGRALSLRWQIELFFKSLKQNLPVADFLGYSASAVRWQIWPALLGHLLLRGNPGGLLVLAASSRRCAPRCGGVWNSWSLRKP